MKPSIKPSIKPVNQNGNQHYNNFVTDRSNTNDRQVRDDSSINSQPQGSLVNSLSSSRSEPVGHSTPKKQEKKYSERIIYNNGKYYDDNGEVTVVHDRDTLIVHDKTNQRICYKYKKENDHTYRYVKTVTREN